MLLPPGAGAAQDLRDFCPDRPGLGTPACTIDRGHAAVELGALDWTLDRQRGSRTDSYVAGDLLVRFGLTGTLEAQLGWTALGHVRTRKDRTIDESSGTGDVQVALRQNVREPDGSGLSVALMPFMTLPSGGSAIGAGDWGAGLLLPVSHELPRGFQLGLTGSVEAASDADGDGRHLAFGAVIGLDVPVGESVGATFELSTRRDRDPVRSVTELLAGMSGTWSPSDALQLDAGVNLGLNRDSPDLQLYFGVARRF